MATLWLVIAGVLTDDSLRDRFLAEAPQGWRIVAHRMEKVEGNGVRTEVLTRRGNETVRTAQVAFALNGSWKKNVLSRDSGLRTVLCANSKYAFTLRRDADEAPYQVTYFGDRLSEGLQGALELSLLQFIEAPWVIDGRSLESIVSSPGFVLKSVSRPSDVSGDYVRVRFQFTPTDPKGTAFQDAWVDLCPSANWVLTKFECSASGGTLFGSVEYDDSGDKSELTPRIRRVVQGVKSQPDSGAVQTTTFQFDRLAFRKTDEREFQFGAFGLPDISLAKPQRKYVGTLTILGLAVLAGFAALVLWRRARR